MADSTELFTVIFRQISGGEVLRESEHSFVYQDRTEADLHNLSAQRAFIANAAELLAAQAEDGEKVGRALTEGEKHELGVLGKP